MPRARCRFTRTEVTRACRAAEKAGNVARVEIDQTGKIILVLGGDAADTAPMNNEWDEAAE